MTVDPMIPFFALLASVYGIYRQLKPVRKIAKLKNALQQALPLSGQVREGDYVFAEGTLTSPKSKTKYAQHRSSLWHTMVQAQFRTKRKKPGKGYELHRPVIYTCSNNDDPLVLQSDRNIVHGVFDDLARCIYQPTKHQTETKIPPLADIKPLVKPKYKSYLVTEYCLPEKAKVVLFGCLLNRRDGVFFLTDNTKLGPSLVSEGSRNDIVAKLQKKLSRRYLVATLLLGVILVCWFYVF